MGLFVVFQEISSILLFKKLSLAKSTYDKIKVNEEFEEHNKRKIDAMKIFYNFMKETNPDNLSNYADFLNSKMALIEL